MKLSIYELKKKMWVVHTDIIGGKTHTKLHYIVSLDADGCHTVYYDSKQAFLAHDLLPDYLYYDPMINYDFQLVNSAIEGSEFLSLWNK